VDKARKAGDDPAWRTPGISIPGVLISALRKSGCPYQKLDLIPSKNSADGQTR
jgi:hypothetical protein